MKKLMAMVLCLVLVLSSAGCGKEPVPEEKVPDPVAEKAKSGDTTVRIDDVVYYNTKKAVPVEPDESIIVYGELPLEGSLSGEKITAYAFLSGEQADDMLVCRIDGEWYRFEVTQRGGQP